MAKLKDLAGLAALGMLGYKLSQGKGDTSAADTGDETSRLAARKPAPAASVVDRPGESTISGPQVNPDANLGEPSNPDYSNEGRTPARSLSPKAAPAAKAKPRTGMTGSQNAALAGVGKQAKMSSESNALAKVNRGMGREVTEAAKYNASSASSAAKPASTASKVADTVKNAAVTAAKTAYPTLTAYGAVPTPEQAAANRQAAYDKVKGLGSSVVDYVKNFETPAERAARERKAASGMKRGGMVKKMAKGGMTSMASSASKRADGIASRGKTKCKMY